MSRPIPALNDFTQDNALFLDEFFLWQCGMQKHLGLQFQSRLQLVGRHDQHEVREEIRGIGVVVGPRAISEFVLFFLGVLLAAVEQQMFQHVGHAAGPVVLPGRPGLDLRVDSHHRLGRILQQDHLQAVLQLQDFHVIRQAVKHGLELQIGKVMPTGRNRAGRGDQAERTHPHNHAHCHNQQGPLQIDRMNNAHVNPSKKKKRISQWMLQRLR